MHVVVAVMRERTKETKEEVDMYKKLKAHLHGSVNPTYDGPADSLAAPYPGLREAPLD
jgi:hypothetical protein